MKKFEIYRPKIDAIAGGACFLLMIGFLIFIIIKVDETSKKIKFLLFLSVLVLFFAKKDIDSRNTSTS